MDYRNQIFVKKGDCSFEKGVHDKSSQHLCSQICLAERKKEIDNKFKAFYLTS